MKGNTVLGKEEQAAVQLRSLYQTYGYLRYKMSKFEEYDFYAGNKDFLVSEGVITFTDTNGKLMALKPDVTLSIIKNSRTQPGAVQKVYYQENVYRISSGTRCFKEIMQTGLECIGDVGVYDLCEVVQLAAGSLQTVSENWTLAISHMGIVSGIMQRYGVSGSMRQKLMNCLHRKNAQEIYSCQGLQDGAATLLSELCGLYLPLCEGIARLRQLCPEEKAAIDELQAICDTLGACDSVYLDFSIVGSMEYYSGIAFNGFVEGLPGSVLSGGAYDNLMKKMGKNGGGVGFAVYLDQLERYGREEKPYDVDVLLLYGSDARPADVASAVRKLTAEGERVLAQRVVPEHLRYRRGLQLCGKEVIPLG